MEEDWLLDQPDPNLKCSICMALFLNPMRTRCGHVFCHSCLEMWLRTCDACPECRAPTATKHIVPDRLVNSLVSNLRIFCRFRKDGCAWQGTSGDLTRHLSRDCPCVTVCCPNEGCETELPRRSLWKHMTECNQCLVDCPWGCGKVPAASIEQHKAECLMEPRKLLAALHRLQNENQRLVAENSALKQTDSTQVLTERRKFCRRGPEPDARSPY